MTDHEAEDDEVLVSTEETTDVEEQGRAGRIFLTLLVLALVITVGVFAYLRNGEFFAELLAKDSWKSRLIGNLHPILAMIPLGLITGVVVAEIAGWLSFGKFHPMTRLTLFLAVITGTLAAASGLVFMKLEGNSGPTWNAYLWFGIGSLVAFALAYLTKIWAVNARGRGVVYAIFLLGGAAALVYGGLIYGQQVHRYTIEPAEDLGTPYGAIRSEREASARLAQLETKGQSLSTDLSKKNGEIANLTKSAGALQTSLNQEKQKFAGASKELATTRKSLSEVKKQQAGTMKQVEQAKKQAANLKKALEEAKKREAELQKKAGAMSNEVNQLKKALEEAKKVEAPKPEPAKVEQPE